MGCAFRGPGFRLIVDKVEEDRGRKDYLHQLVVSFYTQKSGCVVELLLL